MEAAFVLRRSVGHTKKLKVGSMAPVQVHRSGELVGRRAKKKAAPIAKRAAKGAKPRRAR